ncbi:MAG: zinc metallopeptidase [Bacteroidetes bacterium]|nr:zinc metallopeptidase [Bacteroidota bacterium]
MISIWIVFGIFMLISWLIGNTLRSKFKEYSGLAIRGDLTGKEVAEKMLMENGVFDVQVISVEGELTDHYNPLKKTVNLSKNVYGISNVSAAAVAAHECGHAVQHAQAFAWLQMRSALVPFISFSSRIVQWILLAGILLLQVFPALMLLGIILFAVTTLFSFITLPVEIDASRRAIAWLKTSGITDYETTPKAEDALKWAAYTYVVAALASLATLLYYIMIFFGGRRE